MERLFERIFERPAARLLAPRLEAAHLQRNLERAMEAGRTRRAGRWQVSARYRLLLHPSDLVALSGRDALADELAEGLREHARRRGYVLDSRPSVRLEASRRVAAGDVIVLADEGAPLAAEGDLRPVDSPPPPTPPADGTAGTTSMAGGETDREPADDVGATSTFRAAQPAAPRATIALRVPGQPIQRLPVEGGSLRIGRAADNDVVVPDGRVSRHHAQISTRLGTLIYTDLDSSNGSYLQGSRVREIALGPHDVIQLGGSSLTIEPAP
jgi:hypothetical protein